jgi:hypothetical protein
VCPLCGPDLRRPTSQRIACNGLNAGGRPVRPQEEPSQREGQLDDDADYQTAYQSARTIAVNGGRG